jgi:hypothetical protein
VHPSIPQVIEKLGSKEWICPMCLKIWINLEAANVLQKQHWNIVELKGVKRNWCPVCWRQGGYFRATRGQWEILANEVTATIGLLIRSTSFLVMSETKRFCVQCGTEQDCLLCFRGLLFWWWCHSHYRALQEVFDDSEIPSTLEFQLTFRSGWTSTAQRLYQICRS